MEDVQSRGWGAVAWPLTAVLEASGLMGLRRCGQAGSPPETLRPRSRETARAKSLSATYGLGALPLHTDAAHWVNPPRYVALHCITGPSSTPTLLFPLPNGLPVPLRDALPQGIFQVGRGTRAFYGSPD